MNPANIIIVYDGDCMMCRQFRAFVELKKKTTLTRYNMRTSPDIVDHYHTLGFDIDQGIIIDIDGVVYYGAEALTILDAIIILPYGLKKRLLRIVQIPWMTRILYPILLLIRKISAKFTTLSPYAQV